MSRKRKRTPEVFTAYENFVYLLTELELVIEADTIRWSAAIAIATKRRLEELAIRMDRIITRTESE